LNFVSIVLESVIIFKKSLSGLMLIICSSGMLLLALNRNILALLLIGVFFLGFAVLLLLFHAIGFLYIRKIVRNSSFTYPPAVEAGTIFKMQITGSRPFFIFPLLQYRIIFSFKFDCRVVDQTALFNNKLNCQEFIFSIPCRGHYTVEAALESSDYFRFFMSRMTLRKTPAYITVIPRLPEMKELKLPLLATGTGPQKSLTQNALQSAESRPYYPGDDTRLINWKQFSRFNELFIRTAEHGVTTVSHTSLCLFIPPSTGTEAGADQLDTLINTGLRISLYLKENHNKVNFFLGNALFEQFNPLSRSERMQFSFCRAGELYSVDLSKTLAENSGLIFLGSPNDALFIDNLHRHAKRRPLVIVAENSGPSQSSDNVLFIARSLGLEACYV
jgi:uncharacterized protein (DUF58 family)